MSENNSFEYTVSKKAEGKYLTQRILMIVAYVVFCAAYFFGMFAAHLLPLMAFTPILTWMLVFFTWRYVSIEYRYETESGAIRFYNVYGGKKRKLMLEIRIKDFNEIARLTEETKVRLSKIHFDNVYSFVKSENDDSEKYFATFDHDGKQSIVYFEAPEQALKILKYYNAAAR